MQFCSMQIACVDDERTLLSVFTFMNIYGSDGGGDVYDRLPSAGSENCADGSLKLKINVEKRPQQRGTQFNNGPVPAFVSFIGGTFQISIENSSRERERERTAVGGEYC